VGDFRKLVAWQEAKRLAVLSQDAISTLPRAELFALGAQWRRAAYSVSLNIAEGATQTSSRQFRRYLEIAKGSLDEVQGCWSSRKAWAISKDRDWMSFAKSALTVLD
jgi:four helix bundle protein